MVCINKNWVIRINVKAKGIYIELWSNDWQFKIKKEVGKE